MALFHSPKAITDGLILALDAANPKSYPGSGTTWYDLSGNGLDMSLINGPSYANGAFNFDGTSAYAERTGVGLSYPSFTVDTFVQPTSNPGSYRAFFSSTLGSNNDYEYGLNWDMGPGSTTALNAINLEVSRAYGGFYNRDIAPTSNPFGTWVHLSVVVDSVGGTYKQYINGQLQYTNGYSGTVTHFDRIRVGARYYAAGSQSSFFPGAISKTTLYNRALSAQEVLQNYNANKQRFVYTYSEGNNAAPYVGNWNDATTYTMNQFGGLGKVNAHGWTTGPATYTLTLPNLPVHTEVRYKVFWHLVDSLDNETNRLFTMNSAGGETEKLRFTKQYNLVPAISIQDSGVLAYWSGHQPYSYRPWANGYYGQDGYLSIDTGWYSHTANSFTARHVMAADQIQADEAEYLSHVQVYLR